MKVRQTGSRMMPQFRSSRFPNILAYGTTGDKANVGGSELAANGRHSSEQTIVSMQRKD